MHVFILLTVFSTFPFLSGQECPNSWKQFKHTCYLFVRVTKPWTEARKYCEEIDAELLMIKDHDQQEFIEGLKHIDDEYWIGLNDMREENIWQWVDGSELSGYTNWNNGEPNHNGEKEHCVHMYHYQSISGKWNDVRCDTFLPFICQSHL